MGRTAESEPCHQRGRDPTNVAAATSTRREGSLRFCAVHSSPSEGIGPDDDAHTADDAGFRPPLPPEDRIWRHPSEVAAANRARTAMTNANRRASGPRPMLVAAICIAAVFGAGVSLAAVAVTGAWDTEVVHRNVAVTVAPIDFAQPAATVEEVRSHVVGLRVRHGSTWTTANAVVYRSDGHALTTAAIVDGADEIDAYLPDGTATTAELIGIDGATGVAVVRVPGATPATLGSSDGLDAGDQVLTVGQVGAPTWQPMVDAAHVSATGQHLRNGTVALHDLVTLTATGTRPVPGCPVLDAGGAVIGFVAGVAAEDESPAVIPIDDAVRVADQLVEHGDVDHVWLGVTGVDLSPEEASALSLTGGATVTGVIEGSPAESVGLEPGDTIVSVDDDPVTSMGSLITELRDRDPGDEVTIRVVRNGESVDAPVELGGR